MGLEIGDYDNLQSPISNLQPLAMPYFNYRFLPTSGRWERRAFVHDWWRILASDKRWVPPYYPQLRWSLNPNTFQIRAIASLNGRRGWGQL